MSDDALLMLLCTHLVCLFLGFCYAFRLIYRVLRGDLNGFWSTVVGAILGVSFMQLIRRR